MTDNILTILPAPFEWCEISTGKVEIEDQSFNVQPFLMAKYPITYEQFQVFVEAEDGFHNDGWWQGLVERASEPGIQHFAHTENLPRENVSWYDAVAFCRWLTMRMNLSPSPLIPLPHGEGNWQGENERYREMATRAMKDAARELRRSQTDAEARLWECLRNRQLGGIKFRRQHPVANTRYVVDFFCYEGKLIIELDGPVHERQQEYDARRQYDLESFGYRVIRFKNEEIFNNLSSTLISIVHDISPLHEGEGPGVRAQIRLPTEWEWQWAAQGPERTKYPWGNHFDGSRCNTYENGLGKTTSAGSYPIGVSPFGVLDMAGNVWEWCLNERENAGSFDTNGNACRVWRGGSWNSTDIYSQADYRTGDRPFIRNRDTGFRVVADRFMPD